MFPDSIKAFQSLLLLQKTPLTNQESRTTIREGLSKARAVRTGGRKRTAARPAETQCRALRRRESQALQAEPELLPQGAGQRHVAAATAQAQGSSSDAWGGGKLGSPTPCIGHQRRPAGGKRELDVLRAGLCGARELLQAGSASAQVRQKVACSARPELLGVLGPRLGRVQSRRGAPYEPSRRCSACGAETAPTSPRGRRPLPAPGAWFASPTASRSVENPRVLGQRPGSRDSGRDLVPI